MVGHAGSTTGIVHADMTLTRKSRSRSRAFELPKISEAVHAGGNDHQPSCGAFWLFNQPSFSELLQVELKKTCGDNGGGFCPSCRRTNNVKTRKET